MSVLTQVFAAPEFTYSYYERANNPEFGTDEFGKATLGAAISFLRDSYLNTLARFQEVAAEENADHALVIPEALKTFAQMHLQMAVQNDLDAHIAEATEAAIDHLHEFVMNDIEESGWLIWSQDDQQVELNLSVFFERLEAFNADAA